MSTPLGRCGWRLLPFFFALAVSGCATLRSASFVCPAHGGRLWRELTSEHFLLETDLEQEEARDLVNQLERLRALLVQAMFEGRVDPPGRLEVVAFSTAKRAADFETEGRAGFFRRSYNGREQIVLIGALRREQRLTIAHELAHYLAAYHFVREPRWFSEGMATFFETVADAKPGEKGKVGSLPQVQAMQHPNSLPFASRRILEWRESNEYDVGFYAAGWLLVHYLTWHRPDEFTALQDRFAKGEDPEKAWNAVFPEWSLQIPRSTERLDLLLRSYWQAGTWRTRDIEMPLGTSPPIAERLLAGPEVHTIRLDLMLKRARGTLQQEVDEALAEDPSHVAALLAIAREAPQRAQPLARQAVAAHPDDPWAWGFLAWSLSERAFAAERELSLRKMIELAPDLSEGHSSLAFLLLAQGRPAEAIGFAERAVKKIPQNVDGLFAQAWGLAALGRCAEATSIARYAMNMADRWMWPDQRQRAKTAFANFEYKCNSFGARRATRLSRDASWSYRRDDYDDAVAKLQEAVALDPKQPDAWNDLGNAYLQLDRNEEAVAALRRQIEIVPDHDLAWNNLGLALLALSKSQEAEAAFRRQLEIRPDHVAAHTNLALWLLRAGRPREALETAERALRLESSPTTLLCAGRARIAMGETHKGVADLEQAVQLSEGPGIRNDAAYVLAEANTHLELAALWAESAISGGATRVERLSVARMGVSATVFTRRQASYWHTLAWVRFQQRRFAEAERYAAASERVSLEAEVSDHLGQILEHQGRTTEAKRAYARALSLPSPPSSTRARLAALTTDSQIETSISEARAEIVRHRKILISSASAPPISVDLLLVVERDGAIASARPIDGAPLPAGAETLRGLRRDLGFPDNTSSQLALRARYTCGQEGCAAELIGSMF